jgi:hypothetical protein
MPPARCRGLALTLLPALPASSSPRLQAFIEAAVSSSINHPALLQTYCYAFRPIKDSLNPGSM